MSICGPWVGRSSSPHYRLAVGASVTLRPFPAMGRSLSSHSVTPSQAQICLGFWNKPAERAMIPQASLREKRTLSKHTRSTEGHQTAGRELWTDWDFYKNKYQERWMILNSSVCLYYTHKHSTRRSPSIECFCLDKNVLHLSPEFPVILDSGWFPRPKSSSPESTTRDRPITSHTCQEKHVTS